MTIRECPLCGGTGERVKDGQTIRCDCPFDMRPLTGGQLARALEIAKRHRWHSQ